MKQVGDYEQSSWGGGARYLDSVREHWLLIATMVLIAVAAATFYSSRADKRYEGRADILITSIVENDDTFVGIPMIRESNESLSVLTVARLIQTPQVAGQVRKRLNADVDRSTLLDSIKVLPQEQSNILTIVASAPSPYRAFRLANAFADAIVARRTVHFRMELNAVIDRLERRLGEIPKKDREGGEAGRIEERLGDLAALVGAKDPTIEISSRAVPPRAAAWPRPALAAAVAVIAALLAGAGLAVMLEYVNPRVMREDELVRAQRLPVLTRVPRLRSREGRAALVPGGAVPNAMREAYRTLRANLATSGRDGRFPRRILVTSAIRGEGKSVTANCLAAALATAGMRTVLVDGDFRGRSISAAYPGPVGNGGLGDLLLGKARSGHILIPMGGYHGQLLLLLTSSGQTQPIDLLLPEQIDRAFAELEQHADVLVIDSPPITEFADALLLADAVETVLVTARLGLTRRDKLSELRSVLARSQASVAGFVVTTRRGTPSGLDGARLMEQEVPVVGSPTLMPSRTETGEA